MRRHSGHRRAVILFPKAVIRCAPQKAGLLANRNYGSDGTLLRRLTSCQNSELLSDRGTWITGKPRLPLAHHVDHFDAVEYDPATCNRLEKEHGADPAHDAPTVLHYPVKEIVALADANWVR